MSQSDSAKDYYAILGADESTSPGELHRLYKKLAAKRHPDKGGTEEQMKSLNEAYRVLSDKHSKREYDAHRTIRERPFVPVSAPPANDVGLMGHGLSAFFCLLVGLFLLFLVRAHWIRFLWPLAIIAVFVIIFGVLMARSALIAANASLPISNPLRRHTRIQEALFWSVVVGIGYGIYILVISF